MKSRITIEVDFNNGNLPVIQILSRSSDDVRDNLLQSFLQSLQHTSRWCRIEYSGTRGIWSDNLSPISDDASHRWVLMPITTKEIPSEMDLMKSVLAVNEGYPKQKDGFRASNRLDLMSHAEKAITEAMKEVEGVGASLKLTDAVILLGKARDLVYMHYSEQ